MLIPTTPGSLMACSYRSRMTSTFIVGIGEILKIDQVLLHIWPFPMHKINLFVKLFSNPELLGLMASPEPETVQKVQHAMGDCSVSIGTIKACINRDFKGLFSK